MTEIKFKLILAFVDDGIVESVLDAAREAGATGSTIIPNARGQGLKRHLTFFGLEFLGPRSVLMFLVESRRADAVMDAVTRVGKLDETLETGIAIELDVTRATGLSAHIQTLAEQVPIEGPGTSE
jgi:hypothetical protein